MKALAFAACGLLAACVSVSPPDNTFAYRAGLGVVENVREARVAVPSGTLPGSPAAGGRYATPIERAARPRWVEGYQLTLRMDDGTTQAITQDSTAFRQGDRVEVTPQGRIAKVAAVPAAAASTAAPSSSALRPGDGTVQSASSPSAAAGASAGSSTQDVAIRMDDGTTQAVTLHGGLAQPGQRVRITSDGRLIAL